MADYDCCSGFDGVGLADIMKAAGLTHGGFYGHFGSKEDLEAQALSLAMARSLTIWSQTVDSAAARPRKSHSLPAGHPMGYARIKNAQERTHLIAFLNAAGAESQLSLFPVPFYPRARPPPQRSRQAIAVCGCRLAAPICSQQRASCSWLIGRAEDRTYCKIVIIWRFSALDLVALRNIWTQRRNFAV